MLSDSIRFNSLLILVATAHIGFILWLSFEWQPEPPSKQPLSALDIVLVKPSPKKEPQQADFLAQQNQQGSTDQQGRQAPRSEAPAPVQAPQPKPSKPVAPQPPQPHHSTQVESRRLIASQQKAKQKIKPAQKQKIDIDRLLQQSQTEIARLSAEMERLDRYASKNPRRKTLTASTKEYRYAAYLDAWRKKVERIGNLNYPAEAKKRGLEGDLLLHVTLRADGSVKSIRIIRSSGHKILDEAAINIVRIAAPFAPFPENIRREVELLDIIRTWQFISGRSQVSAK